MGISQSIYKVIKSEVIRFQRLQSLQLFFRAGDLDRRLGGGWLAVEVRMRVVICGGVGVDI